MSKLLTIAFAITLFSQRLVLYRSGLKSILKKTIIGAAMIFLMIPQIINHLPRSN